MAMPRYLAVVLPAILALFASAYAVALADCAPAPSTASTYFVADREPVAGDQFFSGERGLTTSRDAVVTRGIMIRSADGS